MPNAEVATRSVYISSPEGDTGKSTIALGTVHLMAATGLRMGVFRTVSRSKSGAHDHILELLLSQAGSPLGYEDCIGVTYDDIHSDPDAALTEIVRKFHIVEEQCDAVLVLGTDYTDIANATEFSFNAKIAANLGTPILLTLRANGRTPEEVAEIAEISLVEIKRNHASCFAVIANRVTPDLLAETKRQLDKVHLPTWVIPEESVLVAPTVEELMRAVDGTLISGDEELLGREAMRVMVAGMTLENVLGRLTDGMVVVTAGDRVDVVLGLVNAHAAEGFPSLPAIILNGGLRLPPSIGRLVDGLHQNLPIITTKLGTYETARAVQSTRGKISVDSTVKIDTALDLMERHVLSQGLLENLPKTVPDVVTPQMFQYQLIQRARADRKHIVLPEGDDDRILKAAGRVVARAIARLTILGDPMKVRARASELSINLGDTKIIDPNDVSAPTLMDQFAATYTALREHKGMTLDLAEERMRDVSYFGTMMVYLGLADGMVSGAAHTTAHTIRPSFEIIKTAPGVSTVSSIFLMCLADKVLAYGDCAVVPEPTPQQLADIAISSAHTASQFGIDPRVAMLSYSTGESGTGVEVEKVRIATSMVRERAPELPVEGPIQYDAAVEPSVAASKMPNSDVAGRATVLIFPDLNTGNNTYKAVQRSAGAVAIGPVLQGIAKPVNDLSRGALVDDIVNTIAITAIQAQGERDA